MAAERCFVASDEVRSSWKCIQKQKRPMSLTDHWYTDSCSFGKCSIVPFAEVSVPALACKIVVKALLAGDCF
jgi:hypothetical protein